MPFRMMRRSLGTASLAGRPWLMAWHDCSVNLGLQWGCRPAPAVTRSLFLPSGPTLIDLAEQPPALRSRTRNQTRLLTNHRRGILYGSLLPGEVRHQKPDGKRAQQAKGKRQPRDREFGGSRKLELAVTKQLSPQESGNTRGWGGMLAHCGRGTRALSIYIL